MEFSGEAALPVADAVTFGLVESQRHEFEVGDAIVQFGCDGSGDDMID